MEARKILAVAGEDIQDRVNFIRRLELHYKQEINNKSDYLELAGKWAEDNMPKLGTAFPKPKPIKKKRLTKKQKLGKL